MYIVLLLLSIFYTLLVVSLLKIGNTSRQVLVFAGVLIVFYSFYCIMTKINSYNNIFNINVEQKNNFLIENEKNNEANAANSEANASCVLERRKELLKEECNRAYSQDNIIPQAAYNHRDCTNDNSCIIPPNEANSFGFIHKDIPNCKILDAYKEKTPLNSEAPKKCVKCNRILTLLNNPVDEDFQRNCDCSECDKVLDKSILLNNMCVHCKVSIMLEHRCINPKKIPKEYYK